MSGGVIIADKLSKITNANFLFFFKNIGLTIPILVKKYIIIGSSKINPDDKTEALNNPI